MEMMMDINGLQGYYLKIVVALSPEVQGLDVRELMRRCCMRDASTLRRMCRRLQEEYGMLSWRKGSNGRLIWLLVGELVLRAGKLYWLCRPEEPLKRSGETAVVGAQQADEAAESPAGWRYPLKRSGETAVEGAQQADEAVKSPAGWHYPLKRSGETALLAVGGQKKVMKPSAGWRFPLKRRGETAVVGAQQAGRVMKPSAGWRFPLKRRGKTAVVGEKAKTSAVKPPAGGSLLKTESINHLQDQSLSDSELRERKNRSVLQNTYILFGRAVRWHQRFGLVPQMELLAWLAQVYQAYRSGRSRKPWGLAYRGLLGELPDKQPDREFSERPWLDLPASFLRACGLPEYAEQAGEVQLYGRPKPQPQPQPQGPAAGAQQPPALFASDEEPQDWPGPQDEDAPPAEWNPQEDVLSRTWSLLLENVKDGMPRSTFEAYLKHTRPQRWDECRGEYWVQAGSDEAAQWLESRLMQTASRILSGMFNRPVKVCFICDTQERPSNAILGENMPTKNM